jgi:hypothetical protein
MLALFLNVEILQFWESPKRRWHPPSGPQNEFNQLQIRPADEAIQKIPFRTKLDFTRFTRRRSENVEMTAFCKVSIQKLTFPLI